MVVLGGVLFLVSEVFLYCYQPSRHVCPPTAATACGVCYQHYRGASLIRRCTPLGPYRRPVPRVLKGYLAHEKTPTPLRPS